jgi:hypothetical protein
MRSNEGVAFSKAEKLGTGTWKLNTCPMDGGGLVLDRGRVVTAWRREHEIFLASPGEREKAIGTGADVGISASAPGVYAIWTTPEGIRVLKPGSGEAIAISPRGSFPSIVALLQGGALAAWENDGKIAIQPVP